MPPIAPSAVALTLALALALPSHALGAPFFERASSFPVSLNLPADADPLTETSAEIVAANAGGTLLAYTDSPLGGLGLVDISDIDAPRAAGFIALDGEPTSVGIVDGRALVALNTSESYVAPSGQLVAVDLESGEVVARCALAGQPDSVGASPDGACLAVAIENERDEELNDGVLPQLPAGALQIVALEAGAPDCDSLASVDLTGLAEIAPSDPEPEFVDINAANEIVLSLQENNTIITVDAASGRVLGHFCAGAVDLAGIDVDEEGALRFDGAQPGRLREPDSIKWLDDERFASANEGDLDGGSRGFTIFSKTGEVLHDSGVDFEYRAVRAGHYPEGRSGNKGIEPEGLEVARFGDELEAVQRRFGAEGVTRLGTTLWVALQRPWADDQGTAKLLAYDVETGTWRSAAYPLDAVESGGASWVGLSEIVAHDGALYTVERDNGIGAAARVKRIYRVTLEGLETAPVGEPAPMLSKAAVADLLPMLREGGGHVVDKIEGLAIDAVGDAYVVSDNDGVDDSNGETRFLRLGSLDRDG